MRSLARLLRQTGFHLLIFLAGFLLYGWPLLGVAEHAGINSLYTFFFVAWAAGVLLLVFVARSLAPADEDSQARERKGP